MTTVWLIMNYISRKQKFPQVFHTVVVKLLLLQNNLLLTSHLGCHLDLEFTCFLWLLTCMLVHKLFYETHATFHVCLTNGKYCTSLSIQLKWDVKY